MQWRGGVVKNLIDHATEVGIIRVIKKRQRMFRTTRQVEFCLAIFIAARIGTHRFAAHSYHVVLRRIKQQRLIGMVVAEQ